MKKIKLLFIIILLFTFNVFADMEPPYIIEHVVMVTNKEGAICYENNKKTDKVIPYGTMLKVDHDISGSFIDVYSDDYNCTVIFSDVSAKTQNFDINNSEVEVLTPIKAIILARGGLNMRKGPAVSYSKILTVPQYKVVNITHKAGSFWYYAEYEGKKGWISGMDGYIGYDGKEVLCNYKSINIYASDGKKVLGVIPANTEINNYLVLTGSQYSGKRYYVIYNDIKGYVNDMLYKTSEVGIINLIKDYDIMDSDGKPIKKLSRNQKLEYTMVGENGHFYFPEKNLQAYMQEDYYEYIKKANLLIKKAGYIGEGLFGEDKEEREPIIEENNNKPDEEAPLSQKNTDIIIICVLSSIIGALTCLVIIKLINNRKKNEKGDVNEKL